MSPHLVLDHETDASRRILFCWHVGLRWAVFGFLALTLPLGDYIFGFHVRHAIAVPVVLTVLGLNALAAWYLANGGPTPRHGVSLGAAIDLLAIGAVLAASGGAANPFSAVFVVHVALAASLLPARTTFALAALAACVFASLFAVPTGACCPNHPAHGAFSTHLYGMWMGFVVAAGLVAFFLTRVRGALDDRGREIARLRREADEQARFAALGSLAAGAAHELATPLGTIAVLAGDIGDSEMRGAISAEVARCRDILAKMAAGAFGASGTSRPAAIVSAARRAVAAFRKAHPSAGVILTEHLARDAIVKLSTDDVEAALCALLDNALHATRAARSVDPIAVEITEEEGVIRIHVDDTGAGVSSAVRERIGEPFVTTKDPGEGMGLGLYLIRTLLARAGGGLEVCGRAPQGTRVTLRLDEVEVTA